MERGFDPSTIDSSDALRWRVRVRPAVHEEFVTQSRSFLSWCDELAGVRFACPRCGRKKAVVRRWRPVGCRAVYWLLCLSPFDRRGNCLSEEVLLQLLSDTVGPGEAGRLVQGRTAPTDGDRS